MTTSSRASKASAVAALPCSRSWCVTTPATIVALMRSPNASTSSSVCSGSARASAISSTMRCNSCTNGCCCAVIACNARPSTSELTSAARATLWASSATSVSCAVALAWSPSAAARAAAINQSVVSPSADTTTTNRSCRSTASTMSCATRVSRPMVPSELPPNL